MARKKSTADKSGTADGVYQLKITLLDSEPAIWRRIHVRDGTLAKLHEHIQTAMGWTNTHAHHFKINNTFYGDPELLQDSFDDRQDKDSTATRISDILPKSGKPFAFQYEYDFGDSWYHEVLFEEIVPAKPGMKYPVCVEGARACPPEDCGGMHGYPDFLAALKDPQHPRHRDLRDWIGGSFDAEAFDAAKATKAMREGLPDWQDEEWF